MKVDRPGQRSGRSLRKEDQSALVITAEPFRAWRSERYVLAAARKSSASCAPPVTGNGIRPTGRGGARYCARVSWWSLGIVRRYRAVGIDGTVLNWVVYLKKWDYAVVAQKEKAVRAAYRVYR